MMKYLDRIADKVLNDALNRIGAVVIEGPRYCGKTTTARQKCKSEIRLDNPETRKNFIALASVDLGLLLEGEAPRLIDEWQDIPQLWEAVKYEVDNREKHGQFILTGSITPPDINQIYHSGVGRITKIKMKTMSLFESGESSGEVSLSSLFDDTPIHGLNHLTARDLAYLICRGGWPASVGENEENALGQVRDYYSMLVESDMSRAGNVARNPVRVQSVIRSYSRHIGTQAKVTQILKDLIANDSTSVSEDTIYSYIDALKKLYVVEEVPAWNPILRSSVSIRTANTKNFSDPSIAAAALGMAPDTLLYDFRAFGLLFKSMCIRDLSIYAQFLDGNVFHYRDSNDLECDAVVQMRDGRWGAIEIKLGSDDQIDVAAKNLNKFKNLIDTEKMPGPSFLMVLSGTAPMAYKRPDGVYVVPLGCLKY
ncbi:MAG: DUF4143 domain-containing protein [Clostridia bacterium]|nr:DUF4143 domain-containing protein [Clostridia bacterium]